MGSGLLLEGPYSPSTCFTAPHGDAGVLWGASPGVVAALDPQVISVTPAGVGVSGPGGRRAGRARAWYRVSSVVLTVDVDPREVGWQARTIEGQFADEMIPLFRIQSVENLVADNRKQPLQKLGWSQAAGGGQCLQLLGRLFIQFHRDHHEPP